MRFSYLIIFDSGMDESWVLIDRIKTIKHGGIKGDDSVVSENSS